MIFKQVFDKKSSTFTYLIASSEGREALIIDPVIENVDNYIQLLNELDLKLVKVIDTHIHADHVTSASALREILGCKVAGPANDNLKCRDINFKDSDNLIVGNTIKVIINADVIPTVIKYPKSITGLIPLTTNDIKATIVVKDV